MKSQSTPNRSSYGKCKFCQGPVKWVKIDGQNIPTIPGTTIRHACPALGIKGQPQDRPGYL